MRTHCVKHHLAPSTLASYVVGDDIVQTTNIRYDGSESCSGKLSRWSKVRILQGTPHFKKGITLIVMPFFMKNLEIFPEKHSYRLVSMGK